MSGHFKQMQHDDGEAKRKLREPLAREDVGDVAYDKQLSYADDRSFKIFGVVFMIVFLAVVLGAIWMEG